VAAGQKPNPFERAGLDDLPIETNARVGRLDRELQESDHPLAHLVEQVDDLGRQCLPIDGVVRVETQERLEVALGRLGVPKVDLGARSQIVGRGQDLHLLEAQVGGPRRAPRLDDRLQLAHAGREVELVDPLARPVVSLPHVLVTLGQVLFLLRQGRRREPGGKHEGGAEQKRRTDGRDDAREGLHCIRTTRPVLRPAR
jgi:hypothetical protein